MFGGSESSSSSSTVTDTKNINFQGIDGLAVAGVDGNVTLTDQGSIEAARDIALSGIDSNESNFSETVGLTRDIINASRENNDTVAGLAAAVVNSESSNADPRLENITKLAIGGGLLIAVAFIFKKGK